MRIILSALFLFILHASSGAHPVHVSVSNLEFEEDQIVMIIRAFRDDLALEFEHLGRGYFSLNGALSDSDMEMADRYFREKFRLTLNRNEAPELVLQKMEVNDESVWAHYKAEYKGKAKIMKIENEILADLYYDQTNLVIINVNGKQNGYRFTHNRRAEEIVIK